MFYCCCFQQIQNEESDCTSFKYNSQENLNDYDGEIENQCLELLGEENYSLSINTYQNIFSQVESQSQSFPLEIFSLIIDKLKYKGEINKIFIPYSKDQQLLSHLIENNNCQQIYTLENDNEYLQTLKNQKQFQKLQYISEDQQAKFDLTIINFCNNNKERILQNLNKINQLSNNQVFIFEYCNNPNKVISKIMKDKNTQKEELIQISISGKKRFYLFFYGKLTSTQKLSRFQAITQILLYNIQYETQHKLSVKNLLGQLLERKISYSKIAQIIGKIKLQYADELKKQQSQSLLQIFLKQICKENLVEQNIIQKLFIDFKQSNQSSLTLTVKLRSHSIIKYTQDRAISYNN